jgi:hypothetical protein
MVSPQTIECNGRADWTLMTAIHDALRRDLDELLHTTAGRTAARARWMVVRDQLRLHLAAEGAAMWPQPGPSSPATRTAMPCWMPWKTSTS